MKRLIMLCVVFFGIVQLSAQDISWHSDFVIIQNLKGDTIQSARLGEEIFFRIDTAWFEEMHNVYFGNVKMGRLQPENGHTGWYRFKLKKEIDGRSFPEVFEIFNKAHLPVRLSLGSNLDDREVLGTFLVVIDEKQPVRTNYSLVTAGILVLILLFVILKGGLGFLKDPVDDPDKRATFSLSRTQFAYWTIIILISFFYVWIHKGDTIDVSVDLLTLLGISAGTTFGASAIDLQKRNRLTASPSELKRGSGSFLMDLIWAGSGPSIHRMQNVAFTIAISSYFLYGVFVEKAIPDIDAGFLTLMGISSGTYLALKSQEIKEAEKEIEG